MFANGAHLHLAYFAQMLEQRADCRDVSIFQSHPDDSLVRPCRRIDFDGIGERGAHGLFQHDVLVRREDIPHDIDVRVIWRSDDQGVDVPGVENLPVVRMHARREAAAAGLESPFAGLLVWIGHGDDFNVIHCREIANMFATHHAGADNAVTNGQCLSSRR